MNLWLVMWHPNAPLETICFQCHNYLFLFRLRRCWILWETLWLFQGKQMALIYLLDAPDTCFKIKWSRGCSFIFVSLCVLFWLFQVLFCACLLKLSKQYLRKMCILISVRVLVPILSLWVSNTGMFEKKHNISKRFIVTSTVTYRSIMSYHNE